jgi:hypothetical protein
VNFATQNLVAPFGVPSAYYFNATRFADTVEKFGVEPTGVECLSHGRKGFRMELCSGENEFEVTLERDRVKLGMIRMDQQRVPLAEGGAASQTTWERFIQIIRQMEDK